MDSSITDAEDAFAVVASRLRLQILKTLDDAAGEARTFTHLYREVDADNTSQFAYHLEEFHPHYVQRSTEGYAIRDVGRRLVESVNAGEYTVEPEFEPFTLDTHCPHCGTVSARATYDGQLATVSCESCGTSLLRYDLRPAHVASRTAREALVAADRQMRAEFGAAIDGVCQRCGGTTTAELHGGADASPATAILACECDHCGASHSAPVPIALLGHPPTMCHLAEHGQNPHETPVWKLLPEVATWDVESSAPSTATVSLPSGRRVTVHVDDGVTVRTEQAGDRDVSGTTE